MKLGTKILLSPILIVLAATVAVLGYGLVAQRDAARVAAADAMVFDAYKTVGEARSLLAQARSDAMLTLLQASSMDDATVKTSRTKLETQFKAVREVVYGLSKRSDNPQLAKTSEDVARKLVVYAQKWDGAIDMAVIDARVGIGAIQYAELAYTSISKELADTLLRMEAERAEGARAAGVRQRNVQLGAGGLLLLACLVGGGLAVRVRSQVMRRLQAAVSACQAAADGDLTSGQEAQREVKQDRGDLAGVDQAAGMAPASVRSLDEIGELEVALLHMVQGLNGSLSTVRVASDHIGTASREIASGSSDLSQRTEGAATNLQETVSSLTVLTRTVQRTADSARSAHELAQRADEVVRRGGEAVSRVVGTMGEINATSRKVSDILSTIDGIAFQTNILALNAAVEAARAGEQGRGFAVVASEVRSLAQRSALAAKEIKSLLGQSQSRVEAGTEQVQQAGQAMGEILSSVQRVRDIVTEIKDAAVGQSDDIERINTAVVSLDQMTQQNAALVEQSAAAAASLRDQVLNLEGVVGRFQLAPGA